MLAHAPVVAHASVVAHVPVATDTPTTWPTETDIIFLPGSNKVLLTVQRPVMRAVIQEAIERTRANVLCGNAFPDVFDTLEFIRDALMTASELNDKAKDIHRRIIGEHLYFINMSRLVSIFFFDNNITDSICSLVHASLSFAGKSRTVASLSYKPNSLQLEQKQVLYLLWKSSCRDTTTPSQGQTM